MPVAKHPISTIALAGTVAVGVGIDTILDDDDDAVSWEEAIGTSAAAAARADVNLMKTMTSWTCENELAIEDRARCTVV